MNWTDEFQGAITVCDRDGIVVYMNDLSKKQFAKSGDGDLLGKSLIECHPEPARTSLPGRLQCIRLISIELECCRSDKRKVRTPPPIDLLAMTRIRLGSCL